MLRLIGREEPDALVIAMRALRQIADFDPGPVRSPSAQEQLAEIRFALACLRGTAIKAIRKIESLEKI